jgi:anti-sigma B factor antagonist
MEFGCTNEKRGRYAVIAVRGELDAATAPQLRNELDDRVSEGEDQLVVDLCEVEFLDSAALGVLVGTLKQLRAYGGNLSLVCTQPRILHVFQITQLEEVFAIHDSVDAATSDA